MKVLSFLMTIVLAVPLAWGQSQTIADFEKEAEGYKVFLYQSVIRLMNKDKNPEFNMLIRDLDHLRFVSSLEDKEHAKEVFTRVNQGVQSEGFEEIMRFDQASQKCIVYESNSSNGKSTWIATLLTDDIAAAIEMKGALDLAYIKALSSLDVDRVKSTLSLDKKESEGKNEGERNKN